MFRMLTRVATKRSRYPILFPMGMLVAVILTVLMAGSLSGCNTTGTHEEQALEKPGDFTEICIEHPVAPQGLVVRGSRAFLVTENDGRFSIVEVSLEDGEERLLVEDAEWRIAVSREAGFLTYATRAGWGEPCEVRVLDLETGEQRKLADTTGPIRGLDLSPDGRALVFASSEGLVVVDLGGEEKRVLVEGRVGGEETVLQWAPVWSPEGTRIAYARTYYEGSGPIFVVDVGTATARAVTGSEDVLRDHTDPHWSPDGKRILYTHSPYASLDENRSDAWMADLSGEVPSIERLTPGDGLYRGLGWSPDGRYVLVERAAQGHQASEVPGDLLVYDTEKKELRELGVFTQGRMTATWVEDGYIYYLSQDGKLDRVRP